MNKEILRMQMLAGIITEGEYKAKLREASDYSLEENSFKEGDKISVTMRGTKADGPEEATIIAMDPSGVAIVKNAEGQEDEVFTKDMQPVQEINEGEYKAKLGEEDSMGNGNNEITLTPQQQKTWEDTMVKNFYELADEDGEEEGLYYLPYASEIILANILLGINPDHDWDDDFKREGELKRKGIDVGEMESKAEDMYRNFTRMSTNNPKIKDIQDVYNHYTS